jgi:DNA-cytosine methyltransferase
MEWTGASLFAGVGGFEMGLAAAGVRTVASVEIDDHARGVLKHRFPDVTLFNDVQEVTADDIIRAGFNPERGILTAGFPCQDVSLAGKRAGLAGARTGLFWEIIRIAEGLQPKWFLLENVPGLLTSNGGRDMGTVIGALGELGYGIGWRVLDAQHFGVPQRRRRVFLAGCLGDPIGAGEVLLEPEGFAGDSAAGGEARPAVAGAAADGSVRGGGSRGLLAERGVVGALTKSIGGAGADAAHAQAGWLIPETVSTLQAAKKGVRLDAEGAAGGQLIPEIVNEIEVPDREVAGTLTTRYYKGVNSTVDDGALAVSFRKSKRARNVDDDETWVQEEQTNTLNCFDIGETRSTQLVTFALMPTSGQGSHLTAHEVPVSPSLTAAGLSRGSDRGLRVVSATGEVSHTLTANGFDASADGTGRGWPTINEGEWRVRRLTPLECERLQGFPDDHTLERWDFKKGKVVTQSDSARGHQIGNAVAVPVITWIAKRMVAHQW